MPGDSCGIIACHSACHGLAPKSSAASAKFGSSVRRRGVMDNMTYGVQNAMCASSSVKKPLLTSSVAKNMSKPIAVTMSGFIIGRSFAVRTALRSGLLHRDRPMTVIVPIQVEITVAKMAMANVVPMAPIVTDEENIFSYQRSEKPEKVVRERDALNENKTVYAIGM